jgi:hypothetical protein
MRMGLNIQVEACEELWIGVRSSEFELRQERRLDLLVYKFCKNSWSETNIGPKKNVASTIIDFLEISRQTL